MGEVPNGERRMNSSERHERGFRSTLSVNGSQLWALAAMDQVGMIYFNYAQEQAVISSSRFVPYFMKRRRGENARGKAVQNWRPIHKAVLNGDNKGAITLLDNLDFPQKPNLLGTKHIKELLGGNVPIEEVLDLNYDADFLKSLQIPLQNEPPSVAGLIVLPDLGMYMNAYPERNNLVVKVKKAPIGLHTSHLVNLPLDKQHLVWALLKDLEGTEQEALLSQLNVFGALAKHTDMVHTHVTDNYHITGILGSGYFGETPLRQNMGRARGFMVEDAKLGLADDYIKAVTQIHEGERPSLPAEQNDGKPSFIHSHYLEAGKANPIVLFGRDMPEHRTKTGMEVSGRANFHDPDFIGIWVTPTFRKHLLHWISTWDEERRQSVFKDRSAESLLISSADQLPST